MPQENLYCIVLAGGAGTRLWPLSRESLPKQFLRIRGDEPLLVETVRRASHLVRPENILIVLEEKQRPLAERCLRPTDFSGKVKIVTEPVGKNTAPAVLLGTLDVVSRDEDAVVMVFPSDHVVGDDEVFRDHAERAVSLAREDYVVSFGIAPSSPETGYGYIEGGEPLSHGGLRIRKFVEKPDAEKAREYLLSGNFFWNSGMFVFRARTMIAEYAALCPEIYGPMIGARGRENEIYLGLPSVPVDRAVMEKTSRGAVVPSSFSWSDIGSWRLFHDFFPKDSDGNVLEGNVVARDTQRSLVKGGSRLVCVNGLSDVAVIETRDAVFVSALDRSDEAGAFAEELKGQGGEEAVLYPWGSRETIERDGLREVTKTVVFPGMTASTENARSRNLRLVVLEGKAFVEGEGKESGLGPGETVLLEDGASYSVRNGSDDVLIILEISFSGS